jgi:hypothetical protein
MKRIAFYALSCLLLLASCNDAPVTIKDSAGKLNDILVVIDDDLWDGSVGDAIRNTFAAPVDGLTREEPQFTLNQVKPASFLGMLRKSRNFLKIELKEKAGVNVLKDTYANPQIGVIINATDSLAIVDQIVQNAAQMKQLFKEHEIQEKQRLIEKVQLNTDAIKDKFGIEITLPQAYRYAALEDPNFTWMRRTIREGTMDIMIYEVPRKAIPRDSNIVKHIIKIRDSIGAMKIPVDDGGSFATEQLLSPYVNETQVNGVFAYETKGLWEVTNKFMSGPFLNYAIYNKEKDNWLIAEGYIYAPSATQRNYLFELEAILKGIKFVNP